MIREFDDFDGAILVDKPAGPTSHDVVDALRRHLELKKVGHAGTLDPGATGLLIVLLGRATKLSDRLMAGDKVYEGSCVFGETTSTYDAQGELVSSLPVLPMTLEEINEAAQGFVGDQMQVPPMVSAVKQGGVPLYKLARKGVEVERKPKLVHVFSFRFASYDEPRGVFRVACTKGTYVRSLVHDLGQKLGCGAHLTSLRRTVSGRWQVGDAIEFEEILKKDREALRTCVIPFLQLSRDE